ncbi:hypothetical protein ACP4OV_008871 [Aristida adscensionis]
MESVPGLVDTAVKLFNLLHESYQQFKELPESVEFVQRELRAIEETIIKRSRNADQDGIRSWIDNLKEIRQRIEDSVDFYNYKVICEDDDPGFWSEFYHSAQTTLRGTKSQLISDIKAIRKLVIEAKERVASYHQVQQTGQTVNSGTYQHSDEAYPCGLEATKSELVHMLQEGGGRSAAKLRVIAISGLGGSGKTILAKAAYHQVKEKFNRKAWAEVSEDLDKDKLLGDILDRMEAPPRPSGKDRGLHLKEFLQDKRYLIGIDDLQAGILWNSVLYAFPDNNMGSRIIVTTTNDRIARSCRRNCRVYRMQPLDTVSARNLLQSKVFADRCPTNLDQGLAMILEICEYHPLAIVNMADHMKSEKGWDPDMCVETCNNIGSLLVNDGNSEAFVGMNQVLNRAYNALNYHTVTCLLSLSTYPKNHDIRRKSLIRRWSAERLITCRDTQPEEVVLDECFTALVDHGFIVPKKVSIGGQVKTFRVHQMVLQFIKAKAKSDNFVTWIDIPERKKVQPTNIRRLYLNNSSTKPPRIGKKVDLSRVRSLTFCGQASKALMNFKDYKLLRVLDLEKAENLEDDNLETVCRSPMLEYLSIRGNKGVSRLPRNILKLRHLVTLDIRDTKVDMVPIEVIQLPELANLFGAFQITCKNYDSSKLKTFFSNKISNMQTLSGFFIDECPGLVRLLPLMPKLCKVRILCRRTAPNRAVLELLISLKACFERKSSQPNLPLRSLSIDFRGVCDLDFLDELEVPSPCYLRSLKICGKLTRLPKFILSDTLRELCLSGTNLGVRVLSELQYLENLQFLKLTGDHIESGAEELTWCSGWLVNLKRLCFAVPKLPKIVIEYKAMEGLESLQLLCTELGGFSGIEHLLRLEEVILASNVVGAEDLSQQISILPLSPKLLRAPADADGCRSGRMLVRSGRLMKREVRED